MICVVAAPNAFKECLPASAVARLMAEGARRVRADIEVREVPVADGGDGTLDALVSARGGEYVTERVLDPLGRPIPARFGLLDGGETAIIEMAEASGLRRVAREERNALAASTYGTGQLILAALARGVRRVVIGIGGSATTDAGCGMAQALGYRLLDDNGQELPPGGGALERLARIDSRGVDRRIEQVSFHVACDVWNPLLGENGAARVFAPQKGADAEEVERLERGLARFREVVQRDLQISVEDIPGGGAAGGLGAGLCAFLGAINMKGAELVLDEVRLNEALEGADLVLTGEGMLDVQSLAGKAPLAVARRAKVSGLVVVALVGIAGNNLSELYERGIDAVFPIAPRPVSQEESITMASTFLPTATEQVIRLFLAAGRLSPGELL